MERALYEQMENCMLDAMEGGAHDAEHVYRVLYAALDIAQTEPAADLDVVIAASPVARHRPCGGAAGSVGLPCAGRRGKRRTAS